MDNQIISHFFLKFLPFEDLPIFLVALKIYCLSGIAGFKSNGEISSTVPLSVDEDTRWVLLEALISRFKEVSKSSRQVKASNSPGL